MEGTKMSRATSGRFKLAAVVAGMLVLGGALVSASPASASTELSYCTGTTFGWGWNTSNHQCIKDIQYMVNDYHGLPPLTIDGLWGNQTASAVEYFQLHGAGLTADGVVGPATWRALCQMTGPTGPAVDAGCTF